MRFILLLILTSLHLSTPAKAETGLQDATQIMRNCLSDFPNTDEKIQKCGAGIIVQFCIAYPLNYTFYNQSMCMMREASVWQAIYSEALQELPYPIRQRSLLALSTARKNACVPPLKAATNDLKMPNYYKCLRDLTAQHVFLWYKSHHNNSKKGA